MQAAGGRLARSMLLRAQAPRALRRAAAATPSVCGAAHNSAEPAAPAAARAGTRAGARGGAVFAATASAADAVRGARAVGFGTPCCATAAAPHARVPGSHKRHAALARRLRARMRAGDACAGLTHAARAALPRIRRRPGVSLHTPGARRHAHTLLLSLTRCPRLFPRLHSRSPAAARSLVARTLPPPLPRPCPAPVRPGLTTRHTCAACSHNPGADTHWRTRAAHHARHAPRRAHRSRHHGRPRQQRA
jgi:hypothetical protein